MVTTLTITRGQAKRIADLAGPRPVPEFATRAEDRRYKRAIIRAVGEVCGKDARKAIEGASEVRVEVVATAEEEYADIAQFIREQFNQADNSEAVREADDIARLHGFDDVDDALDYLDAEPRQNARLENLEIPFPETEDQP